jgi:regulator of replication initiation timing
MSEINLIKEKLQRSLLTVEGVLSEYKQKVSGLNAEVKRLAEENQGLKREVQSLREHIEQLEQDELDIGSLSEFKQVVSQDHE